MQKILFGKEQDLEMFAFFEMTPDLVCIAGKDGCFKKVNPAVVSKLEYSEDELYTKPIYTFIHPEDSELTANSRLELLTGKTLLNFVNRYVSKSGKVIWLEWTSLYLSDKEIVFAIAKDVTTRKLKEKEAEEKFNKYKSLVSHFKKSIEKDRKYLAYELHERLAQLVTALKMDVDWITGNFPGLTISAKNRIENASAISKMLIKTIQRISFSISPNMLDDFGLNATMEWLCNDFSVLNEIPCNFEAAYDEEMLTHEEKLDLFRICQEVLTNVIEHAQAGRVVIRIEETENGIQLTLRDDGKGFELAQQKNKPGLTDMQERVNSFNGILSIQSIKGSGTEICVSLDKHHFKLNKQ